MNPSSDLGNQYNSVFSVQSRWYNALFEGQRLLLYFELKLEIKRNFLQWHSLRRRYTSLDRPISSNLALVLLHSDLVNNAQAIIAYWEALVGADVDHWKFVDLGDEVAIADVFLLDEGLADGVEAEYLALAHEDQQVLVLLVLGEFYCADWVSDLRLNTVEAFGRNFDWLNLLGTKTVPEAYNIITTSSSNKILLININTADILLMRRLNSFLL